SAYVKNLWDYVQISYNRFIRTTDDDHKRGVQHAFLKMYRKGDIYKGEYEGNYCVSCETFVTSFALGDDTHCPECGRDTTLIKEESYFFALSKYAPRLLEWYANNPDCILPRTKKNEVIHFVQNDLQDLSITRTSFSWGIPLPSELGEPKHVMYVWLDALLNYITALGYGNDSSKMDYWQHQYHIIGKDILRFHAVYWPAFLMSLELPLPSHIAVHGWWTRNGVKMSKSIGNVIDPKVVGDAYGTETFRYFMLREVPFGQDGDFSQRALMDRINSDLSNTLGNLLSRTTSMAQKFFGGSIRAESAQIRTLFATEMDEIESILASLPELAQQVALHRYLEELWRIFMLSNAMITQYEPWKMLKEGKDEQVQALLVLIANALLKGLVMLYPVMPQSAQKALAIVGFECSPTLFLRMIERKEWLESFTLKVCEPLFLRITEALMPESSSSAALLEPKHTTKPIAQNKEQQKHQQIDVETFAQSQIRVGTIQHAEKIEKSEKLLRLLVDVGEEKPRQIVAGIGKSYVAESLLGQQVCVLCNL
ncbi:MAG: methionine--tRNA ligase, partial [Helicobacter sp.]|nr:methionine--tRNA ligase [Helicobacter sp.]